MVCVVCFGSLLDVAAIKMEVRAKGSQSVGPMDFDREIQTVGLGNLLSGCTGAFLYCCPLSLPCLSTLVKDLNTYRWAGGFTGSYIFSDTKMALNNVGPASVARLCGLVVAASLLGVYALPISLMTVLPSAFFGGMLIYISFAFLDETLVHTWHTCARMEYGVIIVTLVAINIFGVPVGMVTGGAGQIAVFSLQYGSTGTVVTQRFWHSNVIRGIRERAITARTWTGSDQRCSTAAGSERAGIARAS
eukprot:SAG22_NODE_303_length_12721_cov_3.439075_6_plen_247_part_00